MNALGPKRLDSILDLACHLYGERLALQGGGQFSYRSLVERATEVQAELQTLGIRADEPVIVVVGNSAQDVAAFYGVWKAGGVAVPLHVKSSEATASDVIDRTRARFMVRGEHDFWSRKGIAESHILTLTRGESPTDEMLKDAALVIFTSGSTGQPKGVVLGHRAFTTKLQSIQSVLGFQENTKTLLILQLTFSFGQWVTWLTLATGGTVHMMPKFDPLESLAELANQGINRVAVVPTMMRAWAAAADADDAASNIFGTLRERRCPQLIIAGGEPLSAALGMNFRERLPGSAITDVFGLTETSTSDFILPPSKYELYPGTIGLPTPGVSFRIVRDDGKEAEPLQPGELRIKTPHIMNGYLGDPATTRASFDVDYLRTGDMAMMTEAGTVMLIGRQKEIIVRGGNKISPLEIERVFAEHEQVTATLATGVPDDLMGERIHLLVVLRDGAQPTEDELKRWAIPRLDKFKIPDRIHFGAELPLGRTGKADRQVLRRWIIAEAHAAQ